MRTLGFRAPATRARRLWALAVVLPALACATADPIRDTLFTHATELLLVEGDAPRQGGARFPEKQLPLRELEDWLQAQTLAREAILAVAAGIRRAVVLELAVELEHEFGVRTRVLEHADSVRSSLDDSLDPRATFELHAPDALLVVAVAIRELDEGASGSAVLEAAETAAMFGADRAVSEFHPLDEANYRACALRRGDTWVQAIEQPCAATMTQRILAAIHAARRHPDRHKQPLPSP